MIFTDTHSHLYAKEFDDDRTQVIEHALEFGVKRIFLPNIDSTSISGMLSLTSAYPENCFGMMGLHPCSVKEDYEQELKIIEQWLRERNSGQGTGKFYAVGEIGIDLYWDKTFLVQQQLAFRRQIELAKQFQLPIVIHTRSSFREVYDIVSELNDGSLKGIFHCFSGTIGEAEKVINLGGFKLGIGGVLTFKNSGMDVIVKEIGLEHLVLETDSPYLAPVSHRGKRNESAYIVFVAQKVAELKNISVEEVAEKTTHNSKIIFGI